MVTVFFRPWELGGGSSQESNENAIDYSNEVPEEDQEASFSEPEDLAFHEEEDAQEDILTCDKFEASGSKGHITIAQTYCSVAINKLSALDKITNDFGEIMNSENDNVKEPPDTDCVAQRVILKRKSDELTSEDPKKKLLSKMRKMGNNYDFQIGTFDEGNCLISGIDNETSDGIYTWLERNPVKKHSYDSLQEKIYAQGLNDRSVSAESDDFNTSLGIFTSSTDETVIDQSGSTNTSCSQLVVSQNASKEEVDDLTINAKPSCSKHVVNQAAVEKMAEDVTPTEKPEIEKINEIRSDECLQEKNCAEISDPDASAKVDLPAPADTTMLIVIDSDDALNKITKSMKETEETTGYINILSDPSHDILGSNELINDDRRPCLAEESVVIESDESLQEKNWTEIVDIDSISSDDLKCPADEKDPLLGVPDVNDSKNFLNEIGESAEGYKYFNDSDDLNLSINISVDSTDQIFVHQEPSKLVSEILESNVERNVDEELQEIAKSLEESQEQIEDFDLSVNILFDSGDEGGNDQKPNDSTSDINQEEKEDSRVTESAGTTDVSVDKKSSTKSEPVKKKRGRPFKSLPLSNGSTNVTKPKMQNINKQKIIKQKMIKQTVERRLTRSQGQVKITFRASCKTSGKKSSSTISDVNKNSLLPVNNNFEGVTLKGDSIFSDGLENFLQKSQEGALLLKHKKSLSDTQKELLTVLVTGFIVEKFGICNEKHKIVDYLISKMNIRTNHYHGISLLIFEKVADEIKDTFPNEHVHEYFCRHKVLPDAPQYDRASGSLWRRYHQILEHYSICRFKLNQ